MTPQPTSASIVISSYNYARFLRRCIDSALAQTSGAQVVVVDDASSDDSVDVIRSYGADIVLVSLSTNRGQAAAINAGVEAATGETLFLLDSDDWMMPNRIERVQREFVADSSAQAVRHNSSIADSGGRPLSSAQYAFDDESDPADDIFRLGRTPGSTGCLAIREAFLRQLGPIPEHRFRFSPDYYLLVAAAFSGGLRTINESLTIRRNHPDQVTSRLGADRTSASSALQRRHAEALSAGDLARRLGGPEAVAATSTWWQQKALYEHSKAEGSDWVSIWLRHLMLTSRAPIPSGRKVGELGRSLLLGLVPRRWFPGAWWRTHEGRPRLRAVE